MTDKVLYLSMKQTLSERVTTLVTEYEETGKTLSILLARFGLQRGQFYRTLKAEPELQSRYDTARETFKEQRRSEQVDKLEAQLLKWSTGRGVKHITKKTYDKNGELVETVETEITGDVNVKGLIFLLERYTPKAENTDEKVIVSFERYEITGV